MSIEAHSPLAVRLAHEVREARDEITRRWLERIIARVTIDPNRIFPTDELLDHIPMLVAGIADYIENPAEEIAADIPVVAKAMELGALRYEQGFDAYQILKEYELLGGVLFTFLKEQVEHLDEPCTRSELLECTHRLFHAVALIQQTTTMRFLRMVGQRVAEREERLRGFNRMVSHELKNRLGAIMGAHELLSEPWLDEGKRERFLRMIGENTEGMRAVLDNLISLSRLDTETRQQRNVLLAQVVAEAVRQLREFARAKGVTVRIDKPLPPVEVNAAAVELCLSNYISNAIKYSDPKKTERWVEIAAELRPAPGERETQELVITVTDNGLGVPHEAQRNLFKRFFRAHEEHTDIEGTGLGLSIVRDTVESMGGRAWAEFGDSHTTFAIVLPSRRQRDSVGTEVVSQDSRDEAGTVGTEVM